MKKRPAILIVTILFTVAITVGFLSIRSRASKPTPAPAQAAPALIAGPGKVEPVSEDIQLGSELSGKLKSVKVEEGNHVRQGQVLAELENADYRAEVLSAEADVQAKNATLRKVVNG